VRAGNLFAVDANLLHRPGPRFVAGAEQLCATLDRARAALASKGL
jgi:iron complex transport system substrate-binding protein